MLTKRRRTSQLGCETTGYAKRDTINARGATSLTANNVFGSTVAESRNDHTPTLNVNTNVLGDLHVAYGLGIDGPTTLETNPAHASVGIVNSPSQDIFPMTDNGNFTVSVNLRTNATQAKDARQLTVNDSLTVHETLVVDTTRHAWRTRWQRTATRLSAVRHWSTQSTQAY